MVKGLFIYISVYHIKKLELVFVKLYAPNICFPKYGQICTYKNFWTLLKSLTRNLFIIPYQLTKFQTPSSDLTKGHNSGEKLRICSTVNQVICSSYPIS